jgi:heptosyltransferase-2
MQEPRTVAVVLPGWVGDVVMATPALRALRRHFAAARLIGVAKPYVAGVLEGADWFDHVFSDHGDLRGLASVALRLRRLRVDLAVLLPNSFRSALLAWLGGCRRRIGYARYGRTPLLTDALQPLRDRDGRLTPSPVVDAYNLLAERAGCPPPGHRLELRTTPADEAAADAVWRQAGLDDYREVVCLNPGAAFGAAKHWPAVYFATLARDLAVRRRCGVLVLCGPAERDLARQLVTQARHPSVHALSDLTAPARPDAPGLSLGLSKALVRRADLLVTTDSGPRHFAAAFDRPVVTLFGPTFIAWTETYHPRAVHLQKQVDCGPCQRRVCPLDHRCMTRLTPAEAFAAVERLLPRGQPSSVPGRPGP